MTFSADPYRTLGLVPGAPVDEVKRAYRRLAKRYHPDSAGELEVRRFLAIQAAYEQIVGGRSEHAGRPGQPAAPWDADPGRARATRQGYRNRAGTRSRTRTDWSSTGWSGGSWWSAGRPAGPAPGAASGADRGSTGGRGPSGAGIGSTGGGTAGRARPGHRRKATLRSTSYDEAVHDPFEPSWEGAGWYGASSGTYWTINPREYADPRKHGPEYQARAQRATGDRPEADRPEPPHRDARGGHAGDPGGPASAATAGPSADVPPGDVHPGARSDAAASVGLLAGLLATIPALVVLIGGGPTGVDLLLPALLAPIVVGGGAWALVRRGTRG